MTHPIYYQARGITSNMHPRPLRVRTRRGGPALPQRRRARGGGVNILWKLEHDCTHTRLLYYTFTYFAYYYSYLTSLANQT